MENIYVEKQPLLNIIINKIVNTSNNVQAYLLVGENNYNLSNIAKTLAKSIICNKKYKNNCIECNTCKRIDNGDYGELKTIVPENNIIKKEKIVELIDKFKTYSVEGKNQVYIIENVEYLGDSASNSILKFLEEPESNTVAIFTTNSLNNVLETIKSRCQIIKLNADLKEGFDFIKDFCNCDNKEKLQNYINYALEIEEKKYDSIVLLTKKRILNDVKTREDLMILNKILLLLYKDMINNINGKNYRYFKENNKISTLQKNNNLELLSKKIAFLLSNIQKINYNVNINLYINNLILGIGDICYGKSSRN